LLSQHASPAPRVGAHDDGSLHRRFLGALLASLALYCQTPAASAQTPAWFDQTDYTKLRAIVGASLPTGAGGTVSLVEPLITAANAYFVDGASSHFNGSADPTGAPVTLTDGSGGASRGVSTHATYASGARFFGDIESIAPGANQVVVYDAWNWLTSILRYGSAAPPQAQNFRVQNHSWVWTLAPGNPSPLPSTEHPDNIKVLERFDYVIDTANNGDGMIAVVALNNSQNPLPFLLSHSYNAISVGRSDGNHSTGLTLAYDGTPPDSAYGPGRSKPEIVAPLPSTSAATAFVSSAATMLYESAVGAGVKNEVLKATLLAGATKAEFPSWSRTATQPLDDVYGAGELNVYNSFAIQSGGDHPGRTAAPTAPTPLNGWSYHDHRQRPSIGDVYYNFHVPAGSRLAEMSIALAWNLTVADSDPAESTFSPVRSLKNLDLQFYNSTGQFLGVLLDQSVSSVDNVEHLYLQNLGPGTYTLKVAGSGGADYGLAWRSSSSFDVPSADFNGNGVVDGADFLIWQRNLGTLVNAPANRGDADGDGDVDFADLGLWRSSASPRASSQWLATPEPGSLPLAWCAAALGLLGRNGRAGRSSRR
jgi:hypothetical protein